MEKLITEHPELAIKGLTYLLSCISALVTIISTLMIMFFRQVTAALKDLRAEIKEERQERQEDRDKDSEKVGGLLDRMKEQETFCKTTHRYCPYGRQDNQNFDGSFRIGDL